MTLAANHTYYLWSSETNGGDEWYSDDSIASANNIAADITGSAQVQPGELSLFTPVPNQAFGPVDLQYSVSSAALPSAPTDLSATAGNGQVDLTWSDDNTNVGEFLIERKTGTDGSYNVVGTVTDPTATSYADVNLTPGTDYYYQICRSRC